MKKTLIFALVAMVSLVLAGTAKAGEIKTITLDGNMDEWVDVPALLTNTETWYPGFKGTTWYWNSSTDSWQTDFIDNACMYNEGRALDLGVVKFANDSNYLYFYWEKNSDYMNYFWRTSPGTDNWGIDEQTFTSTPVTGYSDVLVSNPPCVGETLTFPTNYDHDMVYGFDTNLDQKNEYYLIMNITIPSGPFISENVMSLVTVTSYIYKDNGNGSYDGRASEDLVSNLGDDYQQYPSSVLCMNGVCIEGRIKIDTFFTDLRLDWGKTVLVNYEAHSSAALYKTKKSVYSFNKKNKLNFRITSPKKTRTTTKKSLATIKGKVKVGSKIVLRVNKKKVATFTTTKKNFSQKISLKKGNNIIVIKAKLGKKSVTKGVLIRRASH